MKLMTTVEYDEETDELMLPIPDEILDSLGTWASMCYNGSIMTIVSF